GQASDIDQLRGQLHEIVRGRVDPRSFAAAKSCAYAKVLVFRPSHVPHRRQEWTKDFARARVVWAFGQPQHHANMPGCTLLLSVRRDRPTNYRAHRKLA